MLVGVGRPSWGIALNATVGWRSADPVAAFGIAVLALREGKEAWEGEEDE